MKVRWLRRGLAELRYVRMRIGADNPQAAEAIVGRIEQAAFRLGEFPNSGRLGEVSGTRELVVGGAPYLLVYRVIDSEVQVLRLFHQKQGRHK